MESCLQISGLACSVIGVRGIIMPRSKELSEAFRKKVVDAYESGKGLKKLSKILEINHSTVQKISYKCKLKITANKSRPGHPSKFNPSTE